MRNPQSYDQCFIRNMPDIHSLVEKLEPVLWGYL